MPFNGRPSTACRRVATTPWARTTASGRILRARRWWSAHRRTSSPPPSRRRSATWRRAVVLLRRGVVLVWRRPSAVTHVIVLLAVSLIVSVPAVAVVVAVAVIVLVLVVLLRGRRIVLLLTPWAGGAGRILLSLLRCRSGSGRSGVGASLCFVAAVVCHCSRLSNCERRRLISGSRWTLLPRAGCALYFQCATELLQHRHAAAAIVNEEPVALQPDTSMAGALPFDCLSSDRWPSSEETWTVVSL